MMRSLFSGVTGLRSHQTRMDVIGNNIANVNTVGFKKSSVTFKDLYSETISAAAASTGVGAGTTGGVNPKQIGLGAAVGSISTVHTAGSAQYTGNGMDVAISGDGYFVVQTPTGNMYTRAGNFYTDLSGNLITSDGYYVQTVLPTQKAVQVFSFDSVNAATMEGQYISAQDGGVIQTGNVTADLSKVDGKTYSFRFVPSTPAFTAKSTGSSNYFPSLYPIMENGAIKGGIQAESDPAGTTWDSASIAAMVQAKVDALGDTATTGALGVQFEADAANNAVLLKAGNITLATATINAADYDQAADTLKAAGTMTLDFGNGLAKVKITNHNTSSITLSSLIEKMNNAPGQTPPTITVSENGEWQMLDQDGNLIETVTVATSPTAGGGLGSQFKIMTTDFGMFNLQVNTNNFGPVNNQQQLSKALADSGSTFSVNVNAEWAVDYSSPGQVLESQLKTLQIDFDKYSSLAIDSTGGIIAQIKQDQQVTLDGHTITLKAGDKVTLGYVTLANFNNPTGLEKIGDNLYAVSANSGEPTFEMPGSGNAGQLSPSNLEMSNVDLSEEIVNMIITQRGFQANSRIITTTDTMLEELVNLKR